MAIQLEQRLLTVQDYHRMIEAGILTKEDRVELLNGQLIKMSPIGSRHAACVDKIDELLKKLTADKALVRVQNPVITNSLSEPEPDIAIVKRKDNYYADGHPKPDDVYLIIEVADSSLEKDRQTKLEIYASANIPEYWIINLDKKEVEVYQSPFKNTYRSKKLFFPEDAIELPRLGVALAVQQLLI